MQIIVGRYRYMPQSGMWEQEVVGEVVLRNRIFQGNSTEYIFPRTYVANSLVCGCGWVCGCECGCMGVGVGVWV